MPNVLKIAIGLFALSTLLAGINLSTIRDDASGTMMAVTVGGLAANVLLVAIAAAQRRWSAYLLSVFTVLGVVSVLMGIGRMFDYSASVASISLLLNAAALVGCGLLVFPASATVWFQARTRDQPPAEEVSLRRRNVGGTIGVLALVFLLAGAYWLVDPDFTDWEAQRLACLDEADEVARPEQFEACRNAIADGPFSGTELGDLYLARAVLVTEGRNPRPLSIIDSLNAALSHGATDIDRLYRVGESLYELRDAAMLSERVVIARASGDALEYAIDLAPERADIRYLLARLLLWTGDITGALGAMEEARPAYEEDPEFLSILGEAYLAEGSPQRALQAANASLSLVPQHVPSLFLRSRASLHTGDYHQAIDDLSVIRQELPQDTLLVFLDVLAHCGLGDPEAARRIASASVADGIVAEETWYDELRFLDALAAAGVDEEAEDPDVGAVIDAWIGVGCPQSAYPLP